MIRSRIEIAGNKNIIMMCSQSNAAIDDVCRRLSSNLSLNYNIIRIGTVSMANEDLIHHNLTHICEKSVFGH